MGRLMSMTSRAGAVIATAAVLLAGVAPAQAASSTLPMTITNSSGRSEQTFVYVMARSQTTGQQGYVDASGTWRAFALPTSVPSGTPNPAAPDVSIAGPANGASTTLPIPSDLAGGRIYISFGTRLTFQLSPGGLVEPAAWNSSDPNHDVLFDWAEFARNGNAININTTMVDMFSVPMTLKVTNASGTTRTEGALTAGGRQQIFDQITSLGGDWSKLVYTRPSDGLALRVLAPIHGIDSSPALFSSTFFDAYATGVYTYYANHPLTVQTALGTFTGTVSNGVLTFKDSNGTTIGSIPRPSTKEIFGCSGAIQPGGQPNETAILAVGARVCAAFHRATLSTPTRPASDTQATYDAAAFYQTASSDLYSAVMHTASVNGRAYGFAFDDVAEFNPSIDEPNPVSASLVLEPFTGSGGGGTDDSGDTGTGVSGTGAVLSGIGGKCLDVAGAGTANGTAVQLYECNG
ncbi:MAG: glucan endo-1,3-beta-D-glucosidase, partial [Cellulomonadaceae bacterium]|nr:glucan endo-1,3-beta-D-glucosidase [Cellulomonadaceae bacterium]